MLMNTNCDECWLILTDTVLRKPTCKMFTMVDAICLEFWRITTDYCETPDDYLAWSCSSDVRTQIKVHISELSSCMGWTTTRFEDFS